MPSPLKILVVEDDPDLSEILKQTLQEAGYEVVLARDGKMGMKSLRKESFDLVITDVFMEVMDGLELIQTIRKEHEKLPILALSGGGILSPKNVKSMAISFGANGFLQKPLSKTPFLAEVAALLAIEPN